MSGREWWLLVVILALAGFLSRGEPARAAEPAFQYVGAKKCKTCHRKELIGNQWAVWENSAHAKAFETLKGKQAIEAARKRGIDGPPSESPKCLKCHATAFGLQPEQLARKPLRLEDGVQCESCHGPGSGYRKKKVMADRDRAVAKGLVIPKAEDCLRCHNDESPSWNPKQFTLADGSTTGFDFDQAFEKMKHPVPEDVKGHYLEVEKQRRKASAEAGEAP